MDAGRRHGILSRFVRFFGVIGLKKICPRQSAAVTARGRTEWINSIRNRSVTRMGYEYVYRSAVEREYTTHTYTHTKTYKYNIHIFE